MKMERTKKKIHIYNAVERVIRTEAKVSDRPDPSDMPTNPTAQAPPFRGPNPFHGAEPQINTGVPMVRFTL